jgi:hypothetical protein
MTSDPKPITQIPHGRHGYHRSPEHQWPRPALPQRVAPTTRFIGDLALDGSNRCLRSWSPPSAITVPPPPARSLPWPTPRCVELPESRAAWLVPTAWASARIVALASARISTRRVPGFTRGPRPPRMCRCCFHLWF